MLKKAQALLAAFICLLVFFASPAFAGSALENKLADVEERFNGRLGVSVLYAETGQEFNYRAEERFPVCSTFKALLVGAILKKAETEPGYLERKIPIFAGDIVSHSPVTSGNAGGSLSVRELCAATLIISDNAAANLLLAELGGLQVLNEFARSTGNQSFRLDRWEPDLNDYVPGNERDTSTPQDMRNSLQALLLGEVLEAEEKEMLGLWLKNIATGNDGVRSGVPSGWTVKSKTGGGKYGAVAEIALIEPPAGRPLILSVYFVNNVKDAASHKIVAAEVAALVIEDFFKTDAGHI